MSASIDLRRAGPGWTVHFRCGGSAVVRGAYQLSGEQYLGFTEDDAKSSWHNDGSYRRSSKSHPLDIIALDPPPMTEAQMREALAEIAKEMARRIPAQSPIPPETGIKLLAQAMKILALAEGKP